jgi:hypothetical protein
MRRWFQAFVILLLVILLIAVVIAYFNIPTPDIYLKERSMLIAWCRGAGTTTDCELYADRVFDDPRAAMGVSYCAMKFPPVDAPVSFGECLQMYLR